MKKLIEEPVFHENSDGATLEEERHLTMKQIKALVKMGFRATDPDIAPYKVR